MQAIVCVKVLNFNKCVIHLAACYLAGNSVLAKTAKLNSVRIKQKVGPKAKHQLKE